MGFIMVSRFSATHFTIRAPQPHSVFTQGRRLEGATTKLNLKN
jgi:hypothetical protein